MPAVRLSLRNGGKSEQQANGKKAAEKTPIRVQGTKTTKKPTSRKMAGHAAGGKVTKRAAAGRRVTEKAGKIR